ncbi:PREDICTED: E3 SUMO-protein ligase NSE2-like [Ceratosolen solmsi marchali]|uniref:E3 SUMO-protein ligase NSE2 n=1 Tax=Ceratosolen solmsi marchali TaxID=326594 RepID=A0AAJ7E3A7_9HYME|nr:PREDICTED: E3 SUMO-protein ligase NSE2-like [Ceratosolen solmsi marchali]
MAKINNPEVLYRHFCKTASNIITHFDKDERDNILKDLKEIVTNNCICDQRIIKLNETIKDLVVDIDNSDTDHTMKEFKKQRNKMLAYKPDITNHQKLKQYFNEVEELIKAEDDVIHNQLNDDDIQITENDINIIDPFTKKRMIDPVKNKICGHVYDRESTIYILQIKKDTRCPVIGCINKQFILEENLVSDVITRKYLQKHPT